MALIGQPGRFGIHRPFRQKVKDVGGQVAGQRLGGQGGEDFRGKTIYALAAAPDVGAGKGHHLVHVGQVV